MKGAGGGWARLVIWVGGSAVRGVRTFVCLCQRRWVLCVQAVCSVSVPNGCSHNLHPIHDDGKVVAGMRSAAWSPSAPAPPGAPLCLQNSPALTGSRCFGASSPGRGAGPMAWWAVVEGLVPWSFAINMATKFTTPIAKFSPFFNPTESMVGEAPTRNPSTADMNRREVVSIRWLRGNTERVWLQTCGRNQPLDKFSPLAAAASSLPGQLNGKTTLYAPERSRPGCCG